VPRSLTYDLHKLTARLDREADRLLRSEVGVTYPRFLALLAVREGASTQRELAAWLGQTEPSTSRMVGVLAGDGWLTVDRIHGTGNRNQLALTERGAGLVGRCTRLLEVRFEEAVRDAGIDYDRYEHDTRLLLARLGDASTGADAA
jgi:DNA-binding MarR family transcriptional regulator